MDIGKIERQHSSQIGGDDNIMQLSVIGQDRNAYKKRIYRLMDEIKSDDPGQAFRLITNKRPKCL
jgi:hypothetical protein